MSSCLSLRCIGCVYPLRVNVDGFCQVYVNALAEVATGDMRMIHTIYFALEPLVAYFAEELSDALLAVHSYSHGFVMVAE